MTMKDKYNFLWDYKLTNEEFINILGGELEKGRLDRDWAAVRLLEYGSYQDIVHLLGYKEIVLGWQNWRGKIRSESRRRGFDFLVQWLPEKHPELIAE